MGTSEEVEFQQLAELRLAVRRAIKELTGFRTDAEDATLGNRLVDEAQAGAQSMRDVVAERDALRARVQALESERDAHARRAAEAMREACAQECDAEAPHALIARDLATSIRALDVGAVLAATHAREQTREPQT